MVLCYCTLVCYFLMLTDWKRLLTFKKKQIKAKKTQQIMKDIIIQKKHTQKYLSYSVIIEINNEKNKHIKNCSTPKEICWNLYFEKKMMMKYFRLFTNIPLWSTTLIWLTTKEDEKKMKKLPSKHQTCNQCKMPLSWALK